MNGAIVMNLTIGPNWLVSALPVEEAETVEETLPLGIW